MMKESFIHINTPINIENIVEEKVVGGENLYGFDILAVFGNDRIRYEFLKMKAESEKDLTNKVSEICFRKMIFSREDLIKNTPIQENPEFIPLEEEQTFCIMCGKLKGDSDYCSKCEEKVSLLLNNLSAKIPQKESLNEIKTFLLYSNEQIKTRKSLVSLKNKVLVAYESTKIKKNKKYLFNLKIWFEDGIRVYRDLMLFAPNKKDFFHIIGEVIGNKLGFTYEELLNSSISVQKDMLSEEKKNWKKEKYFQGKYCPHCGEELESGRIYKFCPRCGTGLGQTMVIMNEMIIGNQKRTLDGGSFFSKTYLLE